jgi:UDP-N-acetyl-D-mannosaminuronic acid dehydrogenase
MANKICVLGLGYIGLPTSLLLANAGVEVTGFDIDTKKLEKLQKRELYFVEKNLDVLFQEVQKKGTFRVSSEVTPADVFIVAVPTPVSQGVADLKYILSALDLIKSHFEKGNLIIIESTIGPRDCVDILIPYIQKWNIDFKFAHCTERAIPGNTLQEMVHNNRVVGGLDAESSEAAKAVYTLFMEGEILITDPTTAAVCKVMENTYRSVNIALANEFTVLSEDLGFNVWEAINLANKHPRVNIHQPGPGVGGHCIPIDPYFFVTNQNREGITETSLKINEKMPSIVVQYVDVLISKHSLTNPTVLVLGYAYKKNVDDFRETPSAHLVTLLSGRYEVIVSDYYIDNPTFIEQDEALRNADVVILATDHDNYRNINFTDYPNIVFVYDTKNFLDEEQFNNANAELYKLGVN